MRRIVVSAVVLLLLALVGFYGLWPALSLKSIRTALQAGDEPTLAAKVDFPAVRSSLKPVASAEMDKAMAQLEKAGGIGGVLGGQIKDQLKDKLIDGALETMVTPERLIRMYAEGQDFKELMARIKSVSAGGEQGKIDAGKLLGELFGRKPVASEAQKPAQPVATPKTTGTSEPAKPRYSLDNIKGFGLRGATGLWFGVAKDPAATKADVIVDMAFTDGTWKVVGLTPKV